MNVIEQVREGMRVVGPDGDEIGTVELVTMGDPQAVTTEGQGASDSGSYVEMMGSVFENHPDVPRERAERLLRVGYIRIDGKGFSKDSYAASDQLDRVEDDTVYLRG